MVCRPLLCTSCSAHVEDGIESYSAALLMETYPDIDFVVDCGFEDAAQSTVIDMTNGTPLIVREGRGDASWFIA
jgi:tRNA A37 threonylcarbamoyladenosine synthetase subunit TsaC/SUA5/YrdC